MIYHIFFFSYLLGTYLTMELQQTDSYTGYTPMIVRPSQFIESVDAVPSDCCIDSSVRPCYICYKVHHYSYCPYFDYLPKGASFNPGFQIVCECGGDFFEDDWVCSNCGVGRPILKNKYCSICYSRNQHCDYECPKDKVLAAEYKLIRDNMRTSCVRIPYKPDNVSESSRMI